MRTRFPFLFSHGFFSPMNWPGSSNRNHIRLAGGYRRGAFEGQRVWEGIPEGKTCKGVLIHLCPCRCLSLISEHIWLTPEATELFDPTHRS